jgi:hypothetical protein
MEAADDYIADNYKAIIRPLLNKVDKNGSRMYTPAEAQREVSKRLLLSYYGNPDAKKP